MVVAAVYCTWEVDGVGLSNIKVPGDGRFAGISGAARCSLPCRRDGEPYYQSVLRGAGLRGESFGIVTQAYLSPTCAGVVRERYSRIARAGGAQ